ncbi:MAG: PleD family two-component system response regulator [Hyphomicrobium sp.]
MIPLSKLPHPMNVLVADDDPLFCALAKNCLVKAGHEVRIVPDGAQALEALARARHHVAVVDLSMPQIDGFRLIALIRATPALEDLPIIVLSSRGDVASVEEAYRLGANTFLTKPVDWSVFTCHLNHVVRTSMAFAELRSELYETKRKTA